MSSLSALEGAPIGAKFVDRDGDSWLKLGDGRWHQDHFGFTWTSENLYESYGNDPSCTLSIEIGYSESVAYAASLPAPETISKADLLQYVNEHISSSTMRDLAKHFGLIKKSKLVVTLEIDQADLDVHVDDHAVSDTQLAANYIYALWHQDLERAITVTRVEVEE